MEEILQKYNEDKATKQKLEKELNMAKMYKEKDEERLEEAINEFGEHTMDDYGSAVIQSYKEKIQVDASEIEKIEENMNSVDDSMSKIATDKNIQAITIGIEEIEKEIKTKNIELSKKEIELQEFYLKDNTEGKLAQDFYNEQDKIKKEISALESKKQECEELLDLAKEIRDDFIKDGKYKELNKEDTVVKPTETKPAETKPAETKQAETKPTETKPAETKPAETKQAETKPAQTKQAETKPAETKQAETKPAQTKPAQTKPAQTKPEGIKIKNIKIGEKIIISYDALTIPDRVLVFKTVKSNLQKTDEDKKNALNEIMGADIEWTEEQLDGVDYNIISALNKAREDGVTKRTAKEILTSYMGAIAGKEESKQKTKSILTYDIRGMEPKNFFKYMARGVEYEKIKRNSDNAKEFSETEVDEPGFFKKLINKLRTLRLNGKNIDNAAKDRIKENMNEYYNGSKVQKETNLRDREDIKVGDEVKANIKSVEDQFGRDMTDPAYNIEINSKLSEESKRIIKSEDDSKKARQAVEAYKKQNEEKEETR